MSETMEYKCPACGGAMEFNSHLQKMKCPYCDTVMDIEEFQSVLDKETWKHTGSGEWQDDEIKNMKVYLCESCGGQIIAEESTGATSCPYCGSRIVVKEQFSGDMKPDYIIPFKYDKKKAKESYYEHLKGKPFLPKVFKDENHIDEIKGVYVPFWLFDVDVKADMSYNAEKIRKWTSGDTEYTDHQYYKIERKGGINFDHIPSDGSRKMDDTLMESIEPFEFKDAVPFKTAYLAGYMADRYDVLMEERIDRARERVIQSTQDSFRSTVKGYEMVQTVTDNVKVEKAEYQYVLYPVWLLNTTWNNEKYVFAMNGQTGKMVGDLPMDKGAFWKYVVTRGLLIAVVLFAITFLGF